VSGEVAWTAPAAAGPVRATVPVPGSKSQTNRALVLAALASEASTVRGALRARDTDLMAAALANLGVGVHITHESLSARDYVITPRPLRGPASIDVGLAGTVMRFVPPLAALADGDIRFDGDPQARVRPMHPILDALVTLGARIVDQGRGTLPFTVVGCGAMRGGTVQMDASASSQFVSALLLAGARFEHGVRVEHRGSAVPSLPHIEMTVDMLVARGVHVEVDVTDPTAATWQVSPGPVAALDCDIEPDLSNAAPFLAAAMVTAGEVTIPGWPTWTRQAGDALRHLLAQMGGVVTLDTDGLHVRGPARLGGLTADLRDVGELTPVLAGLCAVATEPSHLTGIGHLRGHETDRLTALTTELRRIGAGVDEHPDALTITPGNLRPAHLHTYHDHRMATMAAVVGLVVPGTTVENIGTTAKTLPDFVRMWEAMLA
jgi:3-phosphoshikimate 1-carboxyvinyltransferase